LLTTRSATPAVAVDPLLEELDDALDEDEAPVVVPAPEEEALVDAPPVPLEPLPELPLAAVVAPPVPS
jgi:hypothetical protein